jgi:hypothetical protein
MEFKDGSKVSYHDKKSHEKLYMWGWLGDSVPTKSWRDPVERKRFLDRLKSLSSQCHYMGSHHCEMCEEDRKDYWANTFCGSTYVKHKGIVYSAPYRVEHYIEKHDYRPPDEVIEAILNGEESCRKDYELHGVTLREQFEGSHEEKPKREGPQKIRRVAEERAKKSIEDEENRNVFTKFLNKTK